MTGITKNMHVVYMPWLVSTLHLLKCFPLPAQNVLSDFLGVGSTMDEFKVSFLALHHIVGDRHVLN